ncbi:hypothetical protein IC582_024100 [Cucumis melo]
MQSFFGVCVRQQIPITYNSWKEVPNELKDKIYDCISFPPKIYSRINQEDWESFVDARLSEEWEDYSRIQRERRSKCVYNYHMSCKGYANLVDELKITHDVSYRSTIWKEAQKGRNNDYFDDATRDYASRIDELVVTHKNEDILTDALSSKEHGGRVRGVGGFISRSQYFNTIKGKEKMITPQVEICHKEEDDSRCKSDKKRSNPLEVLI